MIERSGCKKDTMVVVTYDEFGGQWDHVSPPGQGNNNGPHDVWGPGTRIPALILSPHIKGKFVVDSAEHDTTSILATIEHRYGLAPLGQPRRRGERSGDGLLGEEAEARPLGPSIGGPSSQRGHHLFLPAL